MSPLIFPLALGVLLMASRRKPAKLATLVILPGVIRGRPSIFVKLRKLAQRSGVPVVVTSWVRTPVRQARAMLAKVERGENLLALYRDDEQVEELLDAPRDEDAWADIIEKHAAEGHGLSRHLAGYGTDIRTRNLSTAQVNRLIKTAKAMGANAVLESDHLHIGWTR